MKEIEGKGGFLTFITIFNTEAFNVLCELKAATTLFPKFLIILYANNIVIL